MQPAVSTPPLRTPRAARLLQVGALRPQLEAALAAQLLPLRLDWAASPGDYITGHNAALAAVADRIRCLCYKLRSVPLHSGY